ncbi:outer membrane lipoprotein carrier protein LolA [bacterium]|nr:outer membrane lipoprotein carrier protein LolA [bacterium]
MKITTTLLIIVLASGIAFGKTTKQSSGKSAGKGITSKEILSKIDRTARSTHSFQAFFSQTEVDSVFDELYESTGIFYFNKLVSTDEHKTPVFQIRFDYLKPEKSITIIDGGKVIIYTPEMSEPQESYLIDDIKMDAFFAPFFSSERLREHYDMIVTDDNPKRVTVMLSPKTDIVRKHFRELRITFNKANWFPISIYQVKRNGQKITFKFARIKVNRSISQDMFTMKGLKASLPSRSRRKPKKKAKPKKNPGQ